MQEEQTVTFEPMSIYHSISWFEELFLLYLLVMLALVVVRLMKFAWNLHQLRKLAKFGESESQAFSTVWTESHEKAGSLRNFAILSFFISLLEISWSTANNLAGLEMEKVSNWKFYMERFAHALIPFSLGLITCIALFGSAMFMQDLLLRRKPNAMPMIPKQNSPQP